MTTTTPKQSMLGPFATVGMAVVLQVLGAVVLKVMADRWAEGLNSTLVFGAGIVLTLDALRILFWWSAHRRFPLSITIPISSLFFPAMLLVAIAFGESISAQHVFGATVITIGTAWLRWRSP